MRGPAWRYAVEEAVASVTGRRIDAAPLVDEYRLRPWRHALSIVLDDARQVSACEALCPEMFQRSAMKRLLVPEGLGMALDTLRGERIEMGAISREPHTTALRQIQSTGLDRFLSVLAATPVGEGWDVAQRLATCQAFLECPASLCAFVSGEPIDLWVAAEAGYHPRLAGWAAGAENAAWFPSLALASVMGAAFAG